MPSRGVSSEPGKSLLFRGAFLLAGETEGRNQEGGGGAPAAGEGQVGTAWWAKGRWNRGPPLPELARGAPSGR